MKLYYKVLKNTIDNLIELSEFSIYNTYILCGVSKILIEYFTTEYLPEDEGDFKVIKKTDYGIVLNYKGNHVILQKNNEINDFNRHIESLDILNVEDLYDDD